MSEEYRKKRRAINDVGHAHFLTFSCWKRWPLLSKDRSRQWLVDAIDQVRREQELAIWAYVIMPEHVHLLVNPLDLTFDTPRVAVTIPSVLGARGCVAFGRIGKTVRIRRGPAAVSGDKRHKPLLASGNHCVRGRKSTAD